MTNPDPLPEVSKSDGQPVPVFHCQIILSRDELGQQIVGQVANLAGISAIGSTERDVLMSVTGQFREAVREWAESAAPIPWADPPDQPDAGEQQRFVPVHL